MQNCQMCHMPDGNAAIKQMNFADGEWIHGTTIKQQVKVVTDGVPATAMMSFKDRLSDQEILALVKFVRAFDKKLAGKPAAKAKATPKTGTKLVTPRRAAPSAALFVYPPFHSAGTRSSGLRRRRVGPMAHLNVALIGYAFMGRAHSNAYRQVGRFFTPKYLPRMKVLCGRTPAGVTAAAEQLGWEETATDWREVVSRKDIDIVDIATPGRQPRRDRDCRGQGRQGRLLREAAGQHGEGSREDAGRRDEGRRPPHDLPQLPPRARGDAGQAAHRRGQARPALPLPRHLPAGLGGRSERPAGLASAQGGGRVRRARRHRQPLARPRALPGRRDRGGDRRARDVRQGTSAAGEPEEEGQGHRRRRVGVRGAVCQRRARARSKPAALPPGGRTTTGSRSTAARARWPSTSSA